MTKRWTENKVVDAIHKFCSDNQLQRMPTASELTEAGRGDLACAVSSRGGWDHLSRLTGLPNGRNDVRVGWAWEGWVAEQAQLRGLSVQKNSHHSDPYDLIVNGHLVDVKYATGSDVRGGLQWSWRIARAEHCCDFYILVGAVDRHPPKVFVYPAARASLTMVCGRNTRRSHVHKYLDAWGQLAAPGSSLRNPDLLGCCAHP